LNKQEAISNFKKSFERLSYSQDYSTTFNAFLDFALWRLAPHQSERMKDELKRLNTLYPENMAPVICEMFEAWTYASDNDGEGFYDVLGDLFMELVSYGRNGQYFTPQPICDMISQLTYGQDIKEGQTVCDPACGSGRMLMSMAKLQRKMKFFGGDNDHTCAKMCVLNMLSNSMPGEVAWMNSLSTEHYKSYHIRLHLFGSHFIPFLTITGKNETNFFGNKSAKSEINIPENEIKPVEPAIIIGKKNQLQLF